VINSKVGAKSILSNRQSLCLQKTNKSMNESNIQIELNQSIQHAMNQSQTEIDEANVHSTFVMNLSVKNLSKNQAQVVELNPSQTRKNVEQ
jgi:hypothetical protein